METKNIKYLVMKLQSEVEAINPYTGETQSVKLSGCAGYVPVFDNIEDAEEASCNGKYKIMHIRSY